jgi:UDP-N-acetylmuramate dehydrogenase
LIDATGKHALADALGEEIEFGAPLSRHTSLRIGGPADALATPSSRDRLAALLGVCRAHQIPHLSLGAGFNTLVADGGVDGVVLKLNRLRALEERPGDCVFAEAGVTHASLTRFCVDRGLSGLEFGAGIPGVIGGWIIMNAGIGSREVVDVVREIEVMSPAGATLRSLPRDELEFHYRALRGLEPGSVVVSATFAVTRSNAKAVKAEVDRLLAERAESQPLNVPSCGSVFKNPEGDYAGRLIEDAGLKGAVEGGAQISPVHANFIANKGGATAEDVRRLIRRAQDVVEERSGIRLETEVRIVGRPAASAERKIGGSRG